MNEYEILLLLDPDLDDERQGEVVARARALVESGGGTWDLHDTWGRRKLAYEIDHKGEGSYHLLHFTCDAGTLDEVSRVLRIDDGVMRHMATHSGHRRRRINTRCHRHNERQRHIRRAATRRSDSPNRIRTRSDLAWRS